MYTTSTPTAADHMAKVAAAGRITAARLAAEKKAADRRAAAYKYADDLRHDLMDEGAVKIGVKICGDDGKYRYVMDLAENSVEFIRLSLASTYEADAEVWGITADGNYTTSVF